MPEPATTPAVTRHRRGLVATSVIIATVLAIIGIFAVWANRQLLDTDNWTNTSTKLIESDTIRNQLAIFLVDQAYANLDVQQQISDVLPPRAQSLAAPISSGLRTFAVRGVDELLGRPRAQTAWEQANRRAHTRLLQVLEGGTDVVSTTGGTVSLDLKALLGQSADRIGVGGRLQSKLPASAAQIEILKSDQLATAQDAAHLLDQLAPLIAGLAMALFLVGIALASGWRRIALRWCAIGFIVAGIVAIVAKSIVGGIVVDSLATTDAVRPAVQDAWNIGTSLLNEIITAMIGYGLVLLAAAWVAGPTRVATSIRGAAAPYLREPLIAFGTAAAVILLVTWWSPTPVWRSFLGVVLLAALRAVGVEGLRRQTAREFPDADRAADNARRREQLAKLVKRTPPPATGTPLAATAAPESELDRVAALERLGSLRDSGVITDGELQAEKDRIVGAGPSGRFTR